MVGVQEKNYENNPNHIMIRPNEWINIDNNKYIFKKHYVLSRINDEEYKFTYYVAWVQIKKENDSWVYLPLGNNAYKSMPFTWLGDLLDVAADDMLGAKL